MTHVCGKCSRPNPAEASYCYFDGQVLNGDGVNGSAITAGHQHFSVELVFPSGRVCRTFDQLALACQELWSEAVDLLQQGYFENFFGGLGRADLALAAREAARFPDRDRGLDRLLATLPSHVLAGPQLHVEPTAIHLGQVAIGQDKHFELHLYNQGMRLLYGSISCDNCPWLVLGEGEGRPQKLFQFGSELVVPVRVRGKRLRAGSKPLEGRLFIESNGGTFTVDIRAEAPITPFPEGALAGARSPKQLAEKARAHPKEAAALFANGAVARWYKDNGWTYPVHGPAATGLGAIQQFFEALGLVAPPKVEMDTRTVELRAEPGQQVTHALKLQTAEKRPVYASAASNQPWLEVGRPKLNGRKATLPLVVPNVPNRPGETLQAKVLITANGNQRFVVTVRLTIGGSFDFLTAPMPAGAPGAAAKAVLIHHPVERSARWPIYHLVPAGLLVFALFGLILWDVGLGRTTGTPKTPEPPPGFGEDRKPVELLDQERRLDLLFNDQMRFGILMTKERDPKVPERPKRLTYYEEGSSNNTCVIVDGFQYLFGQETPSVRWAKINGQTQRKIELSKPWYGYKSAWETTKEKIRVTQTVEIVPGEQTRVLDTVLIRYTIENLGEARWNVGIRVLLDTFIGVNDGVPFVIPGQPDLMNSKAKYEFKDIPDFIQALENPDLEKPGTIAHLGLKLPDLEPIEKMLIGRWPGNPNARWGWPSDPKEKWDWTFQAMNEPAGDRKDSCVVLYWPIERMEKGDKRTMGFTYGLNTMSSLRTGNSRLSLTAGGQFRPGKEFTVTAYVKNPQKNQTVELHLPLGLRLAPKQSAKQTVPEKAGSGGYTQISWKVLADRAGDFTMEASSGDIREKYTVRILSGGSIFD